jgi:hypothetical protein
LSLGHACTGEMRLPFQTSRSYSVVPWSFSELMLTGVASASWAFTATYTAGGRFSSITFVSVASISVPKTELAKSIRAMVIEAPSKKRLPARHEVLRGRRQKLNRAPNSPANDLGTITPDVVIKPVGRRNVDVRMLPP